MPETIIESVLMGKLNLDSIVKWLETNSSEDIPEECSLFCCNKGEFVAYFLSYLRNQTDSILQTNSNALQILQHQSTPEKIFNSKLKHQRSASEPTSACESEKQTDNLVVKERHKSQESPSKEKSPSQRKAGRKVKTRLFNETDHSKNRSHEISKSSSSLRIDSDESKLSVGIERVVISSTPMKNGLKASEYPSLPVSSPVTPHESNSRCSSRVNSYTQLSKEHHTERCDTPRLSHRHSSRVSSSEKSVSLGDYIIYAQNKSSKKKKTKNHSNESVPDSKNKVELDISNSEMFPEIGAKRSSSHKEKRRIKPTIIDNSEPKHFNQAASFMNEPFNQMSSLVLEQNLAFKQPNIQPKESSNSFDAERNLLKQERHKLMEKFNILNTSSDSLKVPFVPQIKIVKKDSKEKQQNLIKADINKLTFKEKIDILVEIYDTMLKNNLILSINGEMYFLISILLSAQYENDLNEVESKLNMLLNDNNLILSDLILRSVHNCTYFAVRSLHRQKYVLEVMLEKHSLKLIGENMRVRSFCPDLAKFLLNSYGLKCEVENNNKEDKSVNLLENRSPNEMVCFNFETDNAENFPSLLSFQNFKKQRDLFYEILRWWLETPTVGTGASLRSRVKSLISLSSSAANHAHLARLIKAHMLSDCLSGTQESKLTKLQRRFTGPAVQPSESHRWPKFTGTQVFYRDLIMYAENEAFRTHLKDALGSELCILDATCMTNCEERSNSTTNDLTKEYLINLKKLRLLAKFMGFLISLPYTTVSTEYTLKTPNASMGGSQTIQTTQLPKEKVLESEIAIRNYSQPPMDFKGILESSITNNRLCITVPWLVQYLSMLDYASLRIICYKQLIKQLFYIHMVILKTTDDTILVLPGTTMKRNTQIFLKLCLGWLFDLPNFPQEVFYDKSLNFGLVLPCQKEIRDENELIIDFLDLINEQILNEVCPFLKDVNNLLVTSRTSTEKDSSFRHITPVTMSLNPADRTRNKEKELQARLEEELVRGQPSSTRRVLEMVSDRVTSATIKQLVACELNIARNQCRKESVAAVKVWRENDGRDTNQLLNTLKNIHSNQLKTLRSQAIDMACKTADARAGMALQALLANNTAKRPLESVAKRASLARISKWVDDNWSSVGILCKDIEEEMKNLLTLGENALQSNEKAKPNVSLESMMLPQEEFDRVNTSPSSVIMILKEQVCLLLDYEEIENLTATLERAHACCKNTNIFKRSATTKALQQLTVELSIVYISRKPKDFESVLGKLHLIWNENSPDRKPNGPSPEACSPERRGDLSPEFRNVTDEARSSPPVSDDEGNEKPTRIVIAPVVIKSDEIIKEPECRDDMLQYFDRILCPRNIVILSNSRCKATEVWDSMANFVVFLMKNNYLSEDSLTEQCLAVYRQDWPQNVLENLSNCMKAVSSQWGRSSGGKFTLFLDFLAEYCNDMDYEQDVSIMS